MKITQNLRNKNIDYTVIKSIIFKVLVDVFLEKKNIDIKDNIISIKEIWNIFLVKTNKPIISGELYLINEEIKEKALKKLEHIWFIFKDFDIKYK